MNILRWIRNHRRQPEPSAETLKAQKRLERVCKDDWRVDAIMEERARVIRENHLGPAIARALRGKS